MAATKFDSFLSYAHEDRDTVAWLHRLLRLFWVPGKRRRNLFLDEYSLSAGSLTDGLRQALRDSRYLIVCCSEASARSEYVNLEIEEFLATHSPDRILACLVGDRRPGRPVLPEKLRQLEQQRGDDLFTPDLRGFSKAREAEERQRFEQTALSLLAPLVGLRDKGVLLDRRKKTLRLAVAAVALAVLALTAWILWTYTDSYQVRKIASSCCTSEEFANGAFGEASSDLVSQVARAGRPDDALEIARNIREELTRARTLTGLSSALQGEAAEALALEALAVARGIGHEQSRVEALLRSSRQLDALGRREEAREAAKDAFRAASAIEAPEARSLPCARSAFGLLDLGEAVEARQAAEEAFMAAGQIPYGNLRAPAHALAAGALAASGNVEAARSARLEALTAARRMDEEDQAVVLSQVALSFLEARMPAEAHDAARAAIEAANRVEPAEFRLHRLVSIVKSLAGEDEPELGLALPEEARRAAQEIAWPGPRATSLAIVSALFRKRNEPEEALSLARQAAAAAEGLREAPEDHLAVLSLLAETLARNGPSPEAEEMAQRAYAAANAMEKGLDSHSPLLQTAFALTVCGRRTQAQELVDRALQAALSWPDDREISAAYAKAAGIQARWGEYRMARRTALRCQIQEDRIQAYAAILEAYGSGLNAAQSSRVSIAQSSVPVAGS